MEENHHTPEPSRSSLPTRLPGRGVAAPSRAVPMAAGMRVRISGLWRGLLSRLFAQVRFPDEGVRTLSELAERGTIVYVSRTAGLLSYLYFNWVLLKLGLPLAQYVNGVRAGVARLFGRGFVPPAPAATANGLDVDAARLTATVGASRPAFVYLWRSGKALSGRKDTFPTDHVAALSRLQRESERPVFLVPILLVFGRHPGRKEARPGLLDILFGPREAPGRLRSLLTFLRYRSNALVKVGEPIDLRAWIEQNPDDTDERVGRKIRGVLAHYLAREERVVTGPPLKDPDRMQREILRDERLRQTLAEVAHESGRTESEVVSVARKDLKEIAARYAPTMIAILERFMRFVFNRIYDGIVVDEPGLERIARAARSAPLVLCPSHRSHVDYLVLSWVFARNGLTPPHIAAGKNLSFWPLGPILRRAGAFFLRRSFREDRIYSAVFRAYVKKLLAEGFPQEFFVEGTRSRTGKLLPPRLGMVAYEVDAFLDGARNDVWFVPISIGYTRVIEARSYRDELMGAEKRPEDVTGLLKAGGVLRARYGRIYIQIDEPISFARFLEERGVDAADADEDTRRRIVRSLAWHVLYGIDRQTTVTPSALTAAALLSARRRGMDFDEIVERAQFLADYIGRRGDARVSDTVRYSESGELEPAPILEAVRTFADEGYVRVHDLADRTIVEVVPDGRLGLDYYKNGLIHFFVERSLMAHALLSFDPVGEPVPVADVSARAENLAGLLSREFVYRPGVAHAEVFAEVLEELHHDGYVDLDGDTLRITSEGPGPLALLRLLTLNLVEGYWITARSATDLLRAGAALEKEVVTRILDHGRALVLTGQLSAPEALSKPIVQGALGVLVSRGLLGREGRKNEVLSGDPEILEQVAATLEPFVRVPDIAPVPRLPR